MAGQQPSVGAVDWFIDGLLPEGNERTHRAHAVGVDPDDTISMISRFGRDTAGALIFQQVGSPAPTTPNSERIAVSADEIGEMLSRETHHGHVELSPTSLAGIQPKVGLYWDVASHGWYRPPSRHTSSSSAPHERLSSPATTGFGERTTPSTGCTRRTRPGPWASTPMT